MRAEAPLRTEPESRSEYAAALLVHDAAALVPDSATFRCGEALDNPEAPAFPAKGILSFAALRPEAAINSAARR